MGNHFFQYNDYVTLLKSRKETGGNHAFFRDKCVSSCTCWLVQGSLSNATTTKMAAIKTKANNPARASYCLICYFFVFSFNVLLRTWKIHQHLTNWTTWNKSHKFPPLAVVVVFVIVRDGSMQTRCYLFKVRAARNRHHRSAFRGGMVDSVCVQ